MRPPGPVLEAFQLDVTTRPMINFVWLGTLLLVAGGLMSMRRRILENRASPIPDLDDARSPLGRGLGVGPSRRRAKNRVPQPAPSLTAGRTGRGG